MTTFTSSTSHFIEEIEGGRLRKHLAAGSLLGQARWTKSGAAFEPRREPAVYERILAPLGIGPRWYASGPDWVVIERVPGVELWQIADVSIWAAVAASLAQLHACLDTARIPSDVPLVLHDGAHYERTRAGAARRCVPSAVLAAHERACAWLLTRPTGILHGELFASNVLVDARDSAPLRIWPIDWETAARGPVLLDLATLTAGRWSDRDRDAIVAGYRRSAGAWAGGDEAFEMDLDACRLQMCVELLGTSSTWSPPREHQHDWLAEAQLITDRATW